MPRQRYTREEIIEHLGTVELETSKVPAVLEAWRKLAVTEESY